MKILLVPTEVSEYIIEADEAGEPVLVPATIPEGEYRAYVGVEHTPDPTIVIVDQPPVNTILPEITGTSQEGEVLECSTGSWLNASGATYSYQWYFDAVLESGATSDTFTLTSAEVGKLPTCRVRATKGSLFTDAYSMPANVVLPLVFDRVNIGAFGQSPWVYVTHSDSQWDNASIAKPILDVGMPSDQFLWISNSQSRLSSGGSQTAFEYWGVTQANLTADRISAAVGAVAAALYYIAPDIKWSLTDFAVSGDHWDQLRTDNRNGAGRTWAEFEGQLQYARSIVGEIDAMMVFGWGDFRQGASDFMMGQNYDTTPATIVTPTFPPPNPTGLNHILWDVTAPTNSRGRGVFTRDDTKLLQTSGTGVGSGGGRLEIVEFVADPRVQTFALPLYSNIQMGVIVGGHADHTIAEGAVYGHFGLMSGYLIAAGLEGFGIPEVMLDEVTIEGNSIFIPISLPNGGDLTSIKELEGRPDPALRGTPPTLPLDWQPIMGFEITRAGDADTERSAICPATSTSIATKYHGTASVFDTGTGVGTARRGVIEIALVEPPQDGDKINFMLNEDRMIISDGWGIDERKRYGLVMFNLPLETVSDWRDVTATYPFPGFFPRVKNDAVTLVVTPAPPGVGDPQVLLSWTTQTDGRDFETSSFTIPDEDGVLVAFVAINSSINDNTTPEPSPYCTLGTSGRAANTGTALTSLMSNDNRSGRVVALAYAVENPEAGSKTIQWGKASGDSRDTVIFVVWVPDAVLPVAQSYGRPSSAGNSTATASVGATPTATSALSLYFVSRNGTQTATVSGATEIGEASGGSATGAITGYLAWAKHESTSPQSVVVTFGSTGDRVRSYVELVGA